MDGNKIIVSLLEILYISNVTCYIGKYLSSRGNVPKTDSRAINKLSLINISIFQFHFLSDSMAKYMPTETVHLLWKQLNLDNKPVRIGIDHGKSAEKSA